MQRYIRPQEAVYVLEVLGVLPGNTPMQEPSH